MLFEFATPAQTNYSNSNENSQINEVTNKIDSHWQNSTIENKQLPHSSTIDLIERQSTVIGGLRIGPAGAVNAELMRNTFRGKDKRPRKRRECSWCKLRNNHKSYECKGRGVESLPVQR